MDGLTWFIVGIVTGIFKKEVLEAIKQAGIWILKPAKKEDPK